MIKKSYTGGEEITAFRQGILKMAFCWNIAQQLNSDNNDAELTNDGEKIVFMSFPSETGESKLQGGIWATLEKKQLGCQLLRRP